MAEPFRIVATWTRSDVLVLLRALEPKQWAFASARAITQTAVDVKRAEVEGMRSAFDRPRPYTLNAMRIEAARPGKLWAFVGFKDASGAQDRTAETYLQAEVRGGPRRHVGFEGRMRRDGWLGAGRSLLPAEGAPLDAHGNVRRGIYASIVKQLNEQRGRSGMKRAAKGTRGNQYFYGAPGGARGVWLRNGRRIMPMFIETPPPSYRPRFAFFTIAERTVQRVYQGNFETAAAQTIRTAR